MNTICLSFQCQQVHQSYKLKAKQLQSQFGYYKFNRRQLARKLGARKHTQCNSQEQIEDENVKSIVLPAYVDLEEEKQWIAGQIQQWLDDEWTPLDIHAQVGEAASQAYGTMREQGEDEIASVLLGMGQQLLAFDYRDTFVNAFDVANKVSDLLMQRMGIEVCCTGESYEKS
eukprot:TRINITY_DN4233_c2_g1_i3.p6 TRINITY_DN4233_c2_g1~~TRINITY_DN4233_c2_g1_i3.p6  ORF type:complete len:172 (-),score=23.28 TRINITY_DN4233_c2_g1_i3:1151-1666(-)